MDARQFLRLAEALASDLTGRALLVPALDPAVCRSVISRAYYAAFHVARDLLAGFGFTTPRADRAHEYLYRRLNNCGLATVRVAANQFHGLRSHRNQADYAFSVIINSPSLARFDADRHPSRAFAGDGRLTLVYAGALTPIYELNVAVDALAHLARNRPDLDIRLELYGPLSSLDVERTLDNLREAERITESLGDARRLARVSAYMTYCFWMLGDLDRAVREICDILTFNGGGAACSTN